MALPLLHQRPVYDDVNQPVFWAMRSGVMHFEPSPGAIAIAAAAGAQELRAGGLEEGPRSYV